MIQEWNDVKHPRYALPESIVQKEWDAAKETMRQREQKYGHSLRNVPLDFRCHFDQASVIYNNKEFKGNFENHYSFRPNEWSMMRFLVRRKRGGNHRDDVFIEGQLPFTVEKYDDVSDIKTSALEGMTSAYVHRRRTTQSRKDYHQFVMDSILDQKRLSPVEVRVNERNIEIEGRNLYVNAGIRECMECHRPYWLFSDYGTGPLREKEPTRMNPKEVELYKKLTMQGLERGFHSRFNLGDLGGYYSILTIFQDEFCTWECADAWHASWDAKLKDPSEVRNLMQSMVQEQHYDFGKLNLDFVKGLGIVWHGLLIDREGKEEELVVKRVINIGLDGKVLTDRDARPDDL